MKERRRGDGQQTGRVGGGGWERERERELRDEGERESGAKERV